MVQKRLTLQNCWMTKTTNMKETVLPMEICSLLTQGWENQHWHPLVATDVASIRFQTIIQPLVEDMGRLIT